MTSQVPPSGCRDVAVEVLGRRAGQAGVAALDDVLARYDEPHRHHHTRHHLDEMVAEARRLAGPDPLAASTWDEVVLAVVWHDAVYDPRRDDNERRSAELARATLGPLVGRPLAERVAWLVEMTAAHEADADDPAAALVHDADLWILAAHPERYDRYVAHVRREYAHVDDQRWQAGRGDVLQRLEHRLRDVGYLVGPLSDRRRRADTSLANIARERAMLGTS